MYNLFIAIAAALATFLLFFLTGIVTSWWAALLPAVAALAVSYFLLARRTAKQIEALMARVQKEFLARRFDKAKEMLATGFEHGKWQFMVAPQIHSQLGALLYVQEEYDEALPHLEKSFVRHWVPRAMLACHHYRKKDYAKMESEFEKAVGYNKKEGLLYGVYAWCLEKAGEHDKAIRVLARGAEAAPSDERLKSNLVALQNNKKMKMKQYAEQWYQFRLELPPMEMGGPRRVRFERR
jgi:tetratricopeptide (TPR) repeat protein